MLLYLLHNPTICHDSTLHHNSMLSLIVTRDRATTVDDDDEYMNAAAAHAAFVMTVSAASIYWLLRQRHAQHAHDINMQKLHPLPEKIGLGRSAEFLHSGTGYIENRRVRSMTDFCRFQSEFFRTSTGRSEKSNYDFNDENRHSGTGDIEKAVFVPCRFQSRFQSRFQTRFQ